MARMYNATSAGYKKRGLREGKIIDSKRLTVESRNGRRKTEDGTE